MKRTLLIASSAIGILFVGGMILVDRLTAPSSRQELSAQPTPPAAAIRTWSSTTPVPGPPVSVAPPTAAVSPAAQGPLAAPAPPPVPGPAAGSHIDLEFKLDPRLARGLHMGDRWVSPPTYTRMGDLKSVTVEARARVVGATPSQAKPSWTPTEPDMVEVSPDEGAEVKITVWREGESRLTVNSGEVSRTLVVKATPVSGGFRVDIAQ